MFDISNYIRQSQSLQGGLEGFTGQATAKKQYAKNQIEQTYQDALEKAKTAFDKKEDIGRALESAGAGIGGVYAGAKGLAKGIKKFRDKFRNRKKNIGENENDEEVGDDNLDDMDDEKLMDEFDKNNDEGISNDYDIDPVEETGDLGDIVSEPVSQVGEMGESALNNITSNLGSKLDEMGQNIMNKLFKGGNRTYQARGDPRNMNNDMLDEEQNRLGEGDIEMTEIKPKTIDVDEEGNQVVEGTDQELVPDETGNETSNLGEETENAIQDAGEDVTEAVTEGATELGTEATIESVAAGSQVLDAIPIIGEVTALLGLATSMGLGIYDSVKGASQEKAQDALATAQKQTALQHLPGTTNIAGHYSIPVLNSAQNFE